MGQAALALQSLRIWRSGDRKRVALAVSTFRAAQRRLQIEAHFRPAPFSCEMAIISACDTCVRASVSRRSNSANAMLPPSFSSLSSGASLSRGPCRGSLDVCLDMASLRE